MQECEQLREHLPCFRSADVVHEIVYKTSAMADLGIMLNRIDAEFYAVEDKQVHLTSDLDIVPVLTQFGAHSEMKFPVDSPNKEQIAKWIEDRIVAFVHTYLLIHENNFYLKDHLVSDPIKGVQFPKYAAGATQEWKGSTYYFVDNVSKAEFKKKNSIAG